MSGTELPVFLYELIQHHRARQPGHIPLIGVSGAQGSGKTSVCQLLEAANRPRFAHFSLDDVYLTRAERADLAKTVHPLFSTRGPPGTHALHLASDTFTALRDAGPASETALPCFDKLRDDRRPESTWPRFTGRPEAILFDGWCLGALPDDGGSQAINRLERFEDADGIWRDQVRAVLAGPYQTFFDTFDAIVFLQAPNFDVVRRWRGQQESDLLGRAVTAQETSDLDRFIMHYERVTRSMLAGHHGANAVVHLDEYRTVTRIEQR